MSEYVRMRKSTMDSIAKAIQEKDGSTDKISGAEMPARIEAISGGHPWEKMLIIARINSLNDFGTKKVELNLPRITDLSSFCRPTTEADANVTVEELSITAALPITGMSQFMATSSTARDNTLKRITLNIDTSNAKNWSSAFEGLETLEVIDGTPISLESAWVNTYTTTFRINKLREIRFRGEILGSISFESAPLSKASIVNIFSCISKTASDITLTLSLGVVNTAFETSEGAADGSTSAEWLALVEAHSNWTISLV